MPAQGDGLPPREAMDFDVVIVGAGPAGLATAIRLKQRAAEQGGDVSVIVVEKGSEVGAHILSGSVIDPVGLDRLLPEWREDPDRPLKTEVTKDEFLFLRPRGGLRLPTITLPKLMDNHGNFVGSLGNLCRYLGQQGRGARGRDLSGLPGRRGADRRQGRGGRRRHGRHGRRPRTASRRPTSPAAWSCGPSTRSWPRARAAR